MALFIIANSGKVSYGIKQYLCDTIDDIPFEDNGEAIAPGSTVYVVDSKKTYMYNSKGQWVEIITGGGSGGASALSGLSDVALDQLQDGEYLVYDVESGMWKNASGRKIALGKLSSGETTVTIYSADLTPDSTVEVWTSIDGVNYTSMTLNSGNAVLTYPAQSSDMRVKLVFFNDNDPIIYDYELNNYAALSGVDTGIKLRSEANRTRNWEMLFDVSITDSANVYLWTIYYANRSILELLHNATNETITWVFSQNTIAGFANARSIQGRIVRDGSNVVLYDSEDNVLASKTWDASLDDTHTLMVGAGSGGERPQGGTINSFKFRWLN